MKLEYFSLASHFTTKKQTLWLVCIGLIPFLITCKKEEMLETGPCYPLTLTTSPSSSLKVFWYDADQKLIAIRNWTDSTIYTYDTNGNIIRALRLILPGNLFVNIAYDYDSYNNLIRETYRASWGYSSTTYTYQYNSAGQLTTSTEVHPTHWKKSSFQYPNTNTNNPSQSTDTLGSGVTTNSFEYDTRHNPDKSPFPSIHSDNNVTKWSYSYKNLDGGGKDLSNTYTHRYAYNSHGYPTSVTTSSLLDPTLSNKLYTYNCP